MRSGALGIVSCTRTRSGCEKYVAYLSQPVRVRKRSLREACAIAARQISVVREFF